MCYTDRVGWRWIITQTTQPPFEYYEELAHETVDQIMMSLTCDLTYLEELEESFDPSLMVFPDLKEANPDAFRCYMNICDEVYDRLLANELITNELCETHPNEADRLFDYIDASIELYLEVDPLF